MLHCEGPRGASRQRMKTDVRLTPAAAPLQQKGVAWDYSSWKVLSGLRVLSQGSEWPHRRRIPGTLVPPTGRRESLLDVFTGDMVAPSPEVSGDPPDTP